MLKSGKSETPFSGVLGYVIDNASNEPAEKEGSTESPHIRPSMCWFWSIQTFGEGLIAPRWGGGHYLLLLAYSVEWDRVFESYYRLPSCPICCYWGVLIIFLGGGVPPGPENPYPISDQNIRFSTTLFQTWVSKCIPCFRPCNMLGLGLGLGDLRHTGLRDTQNDVRVFFVFCT